MARAALTAPLPITGPGLIGPGTEVTCDYGSLPAAYPNMTAASIVGVGSLYSRVRVHGETVERRVPNAMIRLDRRQQLADAWPADPRDAPHPHGGRYTHPWTYGWLPRWAWIGWSIAEHLEYARGERPLEPTPVGLGVQRLVIVCCSSKKRKDIRRLDAHGFYVGSYYQSARRAADALVARGGRQLILSARFGLLDLHDVISDYDLRMGQPGSVTVETVLYQATQLGLLDAREVIVLAGRAYADIVSAVWPHARRPLDGTRSQGEQKQRMAAIARTGVLPAAPPGPTVPARAA